MPNIKFITRLKSFFGVSELKPEFWEELEELLLTSDVGLSTTQKIIGSVKDSKKLEEVKEKLSFVIQEMLKSHQLTLSAKPHVIMILGVNGTGKTTTIAKLARKFKNEGKNVVLVAADTFRAAAVEQLKIWGGRLGLPVVAQAQGSDSAAVAFDGVKSAIAKGSDVVILDTAGRLHTDKNLMEELLKVKRVVGKAMPGAPHDILLVLDATVGQNGISQAQTFNDVLGLTGITLAKMDGTAKGGVVLAISNELGLPISLIGTGESLGDLETFDSTKFVRDILN